MHGIYPSILSLDNIAVNPRIAYSPRIAHKAIGERHRKASVCSGPECAYCLQIKPRVTPQWPARFAKTALGQLHPLRLSSKLARVRAVIFIETATSGRS